MNISRFRSSLFCFRSPCPPALHHASCDALSTVPVSDDEPRGISSCSAPGDSCGPRVQRQVEISKGSCYKIANRASENAFSFDSLEIFGVH